jgi:hypothetical protein
MTCCKVSTEVLTLSTTKQGKITVVFRTVAPCNIIHGYQQVGKAFSFKVCTARRNLLVYKCKFPGSLLPRSMRTEDETLPLQERTGIVGNVALTGFLHRGRRA